MTQNPAYSTRPIISLVARARLLPRADEERGPGLDDLQAVGVRLACIEPGGVSAVLWQTVTPPGSRAVGSGMGAQPRDDT